MDEDNFRINKDKQRFELEVDGVIAYLTYVDVNGVYQLPHTVVPKEISGRGIGNILVRKSLDYLIERKIEYVPICSFVLAFVAKHKEYDI